MVCFETFSGRKEISQCYCLPAYWTSISHIWTLMILLTLEGQNATQNREAAEAML